MVRTLIIKGQKKYVKRVNVLGRSFAFSPVHGLSFPDDSYWDETVKALLALPGVELVSGAQPVPKPEPKVESKPEPPKPESNSLGKETVKKSVSGPQPATVQVDEPKEEAQPAKSKDDEQDKVPEEKTE